MRLKEARGRAQKPALREKKHTHPRPSDTPNSRATTWPLGPEMRETSSSMRRHEPLVRARDRARTKLARELFWPELCAKHKLRACLRTARAFRRATRIRSSTLESSSLRSASAKAPTPLDRMRASTSFAPAGRCARRCAAPCARHAVRTPRCVDRLPGSRAATRARKRSRRATGTSGLALLARASSHPLETSARAQTLCLPHRAGSDDRLSSSAPAPRAGRPSSRRSKRRRRPPPPPWRASRPQRAASSSASSSTPRARRTPTCSPTATRARRC